MTVLFLLTGCFGKKQVITSLTPDEKLERAKQLLDRKKYLQTQELLSSWVIENSGSSKMDQARFWLGLSHFGLKEYLIAISEFNRLIQEMPESPLIADAQYYIALSYFKLSPFPELDQEYAEKSLREFQMFIETFPDNPKVKEATEYILAIRKKLAEKDLKNAHIYRKMGIYTSAIIYFKDVVENYYDLEYAEEAIFYIGKLSYELGDLEEARKNLLLYSSKYPNGKFMDEVKILLAEIQQKTETAKNGNE